MYARWPASNCSPSVEEMSAATSGETKRDSSVRCRSTASISRAFAIAIAAWSANVVTSSTCSSVNGSRDVPADRDDADQLVVQNDRNAEQRAIADDGLSSERVLRIGQDVGDLHRLAGERHPADDGRPVTLVRMFLRVGVPLGRVGELREDHEEIAVRQVELAVLAVAEVLRGRDDLVEHGLQALRTRDRPQDLADRPPLLAQVLVVPNELLDVECLVLAHPPDSTPNPIGTCPRRSPERRTRGRDTRRSRGPSSRPDRRGPRRSAGVPRSPAAADR